MLSGIALRYSSVRVIMNIPGNNNDSKKLAVRRLLRPLIVAILRPNMVNGIRHIMMKISVLLSREGIKATIFVLMPMLISKVINKHRRIEIFIA